MKKTFTAIAAALCSLNASAQGGHGEIRGNITNEREEPVPFATVRILQDNHLVGGAVADDEGNYHYKPLVPGLYELLVSDPGHITQPVKGIKVVPEQPTYVNVKIRVNALSGVTVTAKPIEYVPVENNMFSFESLDAKELNQLSGYVRGDIFSAMESMSSDVIMQPGGRAHVRGGRDGSTGYFVDGVRTLEAARVPGLAIENITFFTGGVPAMYGDLTSGAVVITTKTYFSGMREKNIRNARD